LGGRIEEQKSSPGKENDVGSPSRADVMRQQHLDLSDDSDFVASIASDITFPVGR
jgi:hypothetical protein